ncbi:hypothetical protein EYF80_050582 [Liparis tanakae]|uniref:Uncharacterized protein n=1 Tax=Liparis tanakae TaxID=230148 RepID=A0A4Z2FDK7_9TELE|nr:hypothetical protein EYF80_050582 [Liparis tanakae]
MAAGCPEEPRRTQPSSPEDASRVLVMFQLTRHTWEFGLAEVRAGLWEMSHLMGTSLKIRTSLVAMASTWKDRPRFGAKAMSWTASVTVIRVSALEYFLYDIGRDDIF